LWSKSIILRILILPYKVDYNCPCIWRVHVIQSCIMITVACTMYQNMNFIKLVVLSYRAATIQFDASKIDYRPADAIFDSYCSVFDSIVLYCSDPHFKQISVDAYQLIWTEQRVYAIAFKTRNFIGWQGLRKPISATDRRRLKLLTWRTLTKSGKSACSWFKMINFDSQF